MISSASLLPLTQERGRFCRLLSILLGIAPAKKAAIGGEAMTFVGLAAVTGIVAIVIVALVVLAFTGGSGRFKIRSGDTSASGEFQNRGNDDQ